MTYYVLCITKKRKMGNIAKMWSGKYLWINKTVKVASICNWWKQYIAYPDLKHKSTLKEDNEKWTHVILIHKQGKYQFKFYIEWSLPEHIKIQNYACFWKLNSYLILKYKST